MGGLLGSLTGGLSVGGGGPASAGAGDSSAGVANDFTSNNAFSVGGSGRQDVAASADRGAANSNTALYVVIGVGALAMLGFGAYALRRK